MTQQTCFLFADHRAADLVTRDHHVMDLYSLPQMVYTRSLNSFLYYIDISLLLLFVLEFTDFPYNAVSLRAQTNYAE